MGATPSRSMKAVNGGCSGGGSSKQQTAAASSKQQQQQQQQQQRSGLTCVHLCRTLHVLALREAGQDLVDRLRLLVRIQREGGCRWAG